MLSTSSVCAHHHAKRVLPSTRKTPVRTFGEVGLTSARTSECPTTRADRNGCKGTWRKGMKSVFKCHAFIMCRRTSMMSAAIQLCRLRAIRRMKTHVLSIRCTTRCIHLGRRSPASKSTRRARHIMLVPTAQKFFAATSLSDGIAMHASFVASVLQALPALGRDKRARQS